MERLTANLSNATYNVSCCERYPVRRREYCEAVGDVGQTMIKKVLEMLGCEVEMAKSIHSNGTDIIFSRDGKTGALEVFNEHGNSYISEKRASRMRRNLRGYKYKGVICNEGKIHTSKTRKILKNVPMLRLGFQVLPRRFYSFFKKRGELSNRRIDNRRTLKRVKNALLGFLFRIGFTAPMYMCSAAVDVCAYVYVSCLYDVYDVDNCQVRLDVFGGFGAEEIREVLRLQVESRRQPANFHSDFMTRYRQYDSLFGFWERHQNG